MAIEDMIAAGVRPPQVETPTEAAGRMMQLRDLAQTGQLRQLQVAQAQQDFADQQTMRQMLPKLLSDPSYQDKAGAPDWDKVINAVAPNVSPKTAFGLQQTILGNQEKRALTTKAQSEALHAQQQAIDIAQKARQAESDYFANLGTQLQQGGYNPAVFDALLEHTKQMFPNYAPHVDQVRQSVAQNPNNLKQVIDVLATGQSPEARKQSADAARAIQEAQQSRAEFAARTVPPNIANQQDYDAWRASLPADVQSRMPANYSPAAVQMVQMLGVPVKDQPEYQIKTRQAQAMAQMKPEDWDTQVDAAIPAAGDTAQLNARTKALVRNAVSMGLPLTAVQSVIKDASDQIGRTETGVRTAKATAPIKVMVAGQEAQARAPKTSTDALDLMAEQALAGQPPSSRNPILYANVMNRAAELARDRGLSAQQAVMERNAAKANTAALNSVTKSYETLRPFGEMAEKNANLLEQKLSQVTDLGTPLLNTPVRELESKFGSAKVAALKASLLPVQADFARILNTPTGSGTLSDHARQEMQQAIQPGATVAQMRAALDVFRQDWQNRKDTYEAQIKDLTGRTVAGSTSRPAPTAPSANVAPSTPKQGESREYQGHTYVFDGKQWVRQ